MTTHFKKYLITEDATIADALVAITENKRGALIVTNANEVLVGIVADGDIRRALVKGASTLTPLGKATNYNVQTLPENAKPEESERIFSEHHEINLIPLVNKKNQVVDVKVRDPEA